MAQSIEQTIYDPSRAFGAFAIRQLVPQAMDAPHWHGHVEINAISGASMLYDFDGREVTLPDGAIAMFWAGVPHRAGQITTFGILEPRLTNVYLPLDRFLLMPHIAGLQRILLAGAVIALPQERFSPSQLEVWQADLETNGADRQSMVVMELNVILRRISAGELKFLLPPQNADVATGDLSSSNVRHVVAMVRMVMENLDRPLSNAEITKVTGLHMNYALKLFSSVMRIPLKRFVIRMRLSRARGLLANSDSPIATIAANCGFGSISQFYESFKTAYGTSPRVARLGHKV